MLMIFPEPCATKRFPTACPSANGAVRFTATIGSHFSRSKASTSSSRQIPAELTSTSIPPSCSSHAVTIRSGASTAVRSISRNA